MITASTKIHQNRLILSKLHQAEADQQAHSVQVTDFLQILWGSEAPKHPSCLAFAIVCSYVKDVIGQQQGNIPQINQQATSKDGGSDRGFWIARIRVLQEGLRSHLTKTKQNSKGSRSVERFTF